MSESEVSGRRRYASIAPSDTEAGDITQYSRSTRFRSHDIYSEAEISDFEAPSLIPGQSIKQSALDALSSSTVTRRKYNSRILIHPGHHDKNFNHIRRMLRPKKRRFHGLGCVPSAGRYGDSALGGRSSRSPSRGRSGTDTEPEDASLIDFTQYDIIARLWLERIKAQSVHKCPTMFLSLFPPGTELPKELTAGYRQSNSTLPDDPAMPPLWVMARSRTIDNNRLLKQQQQRQPNDNDGSQVTEELMDTSRPMSPSRQCVVFFKVGGNWMDMAWVLFNGLQSDPDTVRMIRDIQLKNPNGLAEQMHDLMHRWWSRKGRHATIDELRKALDATHIAYIREEFNDVRSSVIPYSDTEDELDVGDINKSNPNVTRMIQEYDFRSMNVSVYPEQTLLSLPAKREPLDMTQDVIMRRQRAPHRRSDGSSWRLHSTTSELFPVSHDQNDTSRYFVEQTRSTADDESQSASAYIDPQLYAAQYKRVSNL